MLNTIVPYGQTFLLAVIIYSQFVFFVQKYIEYDMRLLQSELDKLGGYLPELQVVLLLPLQLKRQKNHTLSILQKQGFYTLV